jgi:hypothetical protein
MYLYRHPRETRENKLQAGHIINDWARPIFRKEDNLAHMTREDRRARDDAMAKRRQFKRLRKPDDEQEAVKPGERLARPPATPGDPGWVSRARVPMPDAQEYIKRPDWQTTVQIDTAPKKKTVSDAMYVRVGECGAQVNLLEKHKRKFAEKRRQTRTVSMTKISIEGARMKLGQDGLNVG